MVAIKHKNAEELKKYGETEASFVDYAKFEDDDAARAAAKAEFVDNEVYTPKYAYPKLDRLYDTPLDNDPNSKETLQEKKSQVIEAVLELEANKYSGELPEELCELYAAFQEKKLQRILLVEAAQRLRTAGSSTERDVAQYEYMQLNNELHGEMNKELFDTIMHEQLAMVESFNPADEQAASIKRELLRAIGPREFVHHPEYDMEFDEVSLAKLRAEVNRRYAKSLDKIPDTPDDVYYDAKECEAILQQCLDAEGLGAQGWKCEVDPKKSNPATNSEKQKIFLPASTRRNAAELRRLWLHEGGVHAARGANGAKTGYRPLRLGTANYADVEEGLGVILECIESGSIKNSPAYIRARDRYILAGLALGTDGVPRDGRQTYEITWRLLALRSAKDGRIGVDAIAKAKKDATVHDENAFRSTDFAHVGVIYSKLKVYLEGLQKNFTYLMDNIDNLEQALDDAMIGKSDHTDPTELAQVKSLTANT